jgi:hypothetical protein
LKKIVEQNPQVMYEWTTLFLSTQLPTIMGLEEEPKTTSEIKALVLQSIFGMKEKKKFKSLILDFSAVCNGQLSHDVLLSYRVVQK